MDLEAVISVTLGRGNHKLILCRIKAKSKASALNDNLNSFTLACFYACIVVCLL